MWAKNGKLVLHYKKITSTVESTAKDQSISKSFLVTFNVQRIAPFNNYILAPVSVI